jgi:hypothetical protein
VVAELLREGGESVAAALHLLCARCFAVGCVPLAWLRGVVVPLFKDGDRRVPANYRPITLLSIVRKVFASTLLARLEAWCERNNKLAPEQGGFRKGRGTAEQLFALTELIKLRRLRGRATFACFIDIRKAYDTVWHAGLRRQLREAGIGGRFYRALCSLYDGCESALRLGGQAAWTEFFPVRQGVRQGCVLSPLLYSLFINPLADALRASGLGATIDEAGVRRLACLLYADDIVLLANSEEELQQLMARVDVFARRWQFSVNPSKCACVRFNVRGGALPTSAGLALGEKTVPWVEGYRYLGVELRAAPGRCYLAQQRRMLVSATRAAASLAALGLHSGRFPVPPAVRAYKSLVRPLLEYAAEVVSLAPWTEAEQLQSRVARRILQCPLRASGTAARGELALPALETRWLLLRLLFWGKLQRAGDDLPARWVYDESLRLYQDPLYLHQAQHFPALAHRAEQPWQVQRAAHSAGVPSLWCAQLHRDLASLGRLDVWNEPARVSRLSAQAWHSLALRLTESREQANWWHHVSVASERLPLVPLLRTPGTRPFNLAASLQVSHGGWSDRIRVGRIALTQLRLGAALLRERTGAWEQVPVASRHCPMCGVGVEDERHFLLHCAYFATQRLAFARRCAAEANVRIGDMDDDRRLRTMLGVTPPGCSKDGAATFARMLCFEVGQWFRDRMEHEKLIRMQR